MLAARLILLNDLDAYAVLYQAPAQIVGCLAAAYDHSLPYIKLLGSYPHEKAPGRLHGGDKGDDISGPQHEAAVRDDKFTVPLDYADQHVALYLSSHVYEAHSVENIPLCYLETDDLRACVGKRIHFQCRRKAEHPGDLLRCLVFRVYDHGKLQFILEIGHLGAVLGSPYPGDSGTAA